MPDDADGLGAQRDLMHAVDACREAGGRAGLAKALTALAYLERSAGRRDDALKYYAEAADLYREEGDAIKTAHTIRHVGDIHQDQGRPDLAEPCYHEALEIYRNHTETAPLDLANCIRGLAVLKDRGGELAYATLLWEEARSLYASVQVQAGVAESSRRIAELARRRMETG